jgi:SAM-dependent methyltransferase
MGTSAYNKYPPEYTFEGKKVLNIGCGYAAYKAPNVINLDAYGDVQVKWDLGSEKPLPFADEMFDFILANHILEHVPNWWHCFEECARVLKVGGLMQVFVPGAGSDSVLGFRDHINTINHCSWWGIRNFIENPNNAWAAENAEGPAAAMHMIKQVPHLDRELPWLKRTPKFLYPWIATHLRNVIKEMEFVFRKEATTSAPVLHYESVEALL